METDLQCLADSNCDGQEGEEVNSGLNSNKEEAKRPRSYNIADRIDVTPAFQGDFKVVGLLMYIGRSNCSTKTSVRDGGVAMYGRWKAKLAGRCVKCGR